MIYIVWDKSYKYDDLEAQYNKLEFMTTDYEKAIEYFKRFHSKETPSEDYYYRYDLYEYPNNWYCYGDKKYGTNEFKIIETICNSNE